MCCSPDYCYDDIDKNTYVAKRQRECCACDEPIRRGDRYRVTRTTQTQADDQPRFEAYTHCLRCAAVLDAVREARPDDAIAWRLDCGEDWLESIGELPDDIANLAFLTADEVQQQLARRQR